MAPAPPIAPDHVFVNCPFDDEYTETFRALIFAIRACGFQPRSARELDDSGQPRIEKLYGLIKECRYCRASGQLGALDPRHSQLDPNRHRGAKSA